MYNVVFKGEITKSQTLKEVKNKIAILYNVDVDKIEGLFQNKSITLKESIDYHTALKDKETFEQTGAICHIEAVESPKEEPPPIPIQAEKTGYNDTQTASPGSGQHSAETRNRNFSIFHPLFMSFYSKIFYRDVCRNWKGFSFLYLLFILSLTSLFMALQAHTIFSNFIKQSAPAIIDQMPVITINNGKASINEDTPYIIRDPGTGQKIIIIDTSGKTQSINSSGAYILLTETELIARESENQKRVFRLADIGNHIIDHKFLYDKLYIMETWLPVFAFPLILLMSYVWRILQVLVYTVIGRMFSNILNVKLEFHSLISIAIMSITPVLILDVFFRLSGLATSLWTFIGILIAMAYMFFGIKANAITDRREKEKTVR